jgi:hypothetical protein
MTDQSTTQQSGSHAAHAKFNASASATWIHCGAAIFFAEANRHRQKPNRSVYSDEGTTAHDHAADVLTYKTLIEEIPDDFRTHVKFYTDHCEDLMAQGGKIFVEESCPLYYSPKEKGTTDFGLVTSEKIIIRDLKYGQGELVDADRNSQLAIYAMSLVDANRKDFDFSPETIVDLGIVQPRHHGDDPVRVWQVSLGDLEYFLEEELGVKRKIAIYRDADVRFKKQYASHLQSIDDYLSGKTKTKPRDVSEEEIEQALGLEFAPCVKACRWCKARHFCKRRIDNAASPIGFDVLTDLPDLTKEEKKLPVGERIKATVGDGYSDEDLVRFWLGRKQRAALDKDIEEYLESLAEQGRPAPGTKLVMGREGNRKWADEDAAENFLARTAKLKQDERFKFVLISPTQAEEILSDKLTDRQQKRLKELITRSHGTPSLAPADDKRPAIAAPCDAFDDLTAEPELDSDL